MTAIPFGKMTDGSEILLYKLENSKGASVSIMTYGATLVSARVPDRSGRIADVLLGYDDLQSYVQDRSYFGCIVGRYGNRIGKGRFSIGGQTFQVTVNDGENHLHGGKQGFHKVVWHARANPASQAPSVIMEYKSPDGADGYPGTVAIRVTYTWTERNELIIDYLGSTDKKTILNPTSHGYFNLTGDPGQTILDHELKIAAESFTPVDQGLIPTGEIASVEETPLDFRKATRIGARISAPHAQIAMAKGYDHNWVLDNFGTAVRAVAELYDPASGRLLRVLTDQPGLQFYSGNFLDGTVKGKAGVFYKLRTGLCLEAQYFPDSPNRANFPPVLLEPGATYRQTTIYHFSYK